MASAGETAGEAGAVHSAPTPPGRDATVPTRPAGIFQTPAGADAALIHVWKGPIAQTCAVTNTRYFQQQKITPNSAGSETQALLTSAYFDFDTNCLSARSFFTS